MCGLAGLRALVICTPSSLYCVLAYILYELIYCLRKPRFCVPQLQKSIPQSKVRVNVILFDNNIQLKINVQMAYTVRSSLINSVTYFIQWKLCNYLSGSERFRSLPWIIILKVKIYRSLLNALQSNNIKYNYNFLGVCQEIV